MASCVRNICAKNYRNLLICFQVTVENVGDVFLGHSVVVCRQTYNQHQGQLSLLSLWCSWIKYRSVWLALRWGESFHLCQVTLCINMWKVVLRSSEMDNGVKNDTQPYNL